MARNNETPLIQSTQMIVPGCRAVGTHPYTAMCSGPIRVTEQATLLQSAALFS